jgi:hypothetical protein
MSRDLGRARAATSAAGIVLAVGAVAAVLGGCGPQGAGATGASGTTVGTTAGVPSSTSGTTEPGAGRMTAGLSTPLVMTRSGGIAGVQDRLVVRPDGTFTATSRGKAPVTRQLTEAEQAAVVAAVAAADLPMLARLQTPRTAGGAENDVFSYVVQAEGSSVAASQSRVAPALQRLLDVLQPLFAAPAATP